MISSTPLTFINSLDHYLENLCLQQQCHYGLQNKRNDTLSIDFIRETFEGLFTTVYKVLPNLIAHTHIPMVYHLAI